MKKFLITFFWLSKIFSHNYDYDLIIIGAGAAGLTAGHVAAEIGKKVLLIEKKIIGGGRIWSGDIPFKALFRNAEMLYAASHLNTINLKIDVQEIFESDSVLNGVRYTRDQIYELIKKDLSKRKNVTIKFGLPFFIDSHSLSCEGGIFSAEHIIIATGSSAFVPPLQGIEDVPILTRENFFDLDRLPKSLVIVGGGPLGAEMASGLTKLGVKVTLLMKHGMLMPTSDFELIQQLTNSLLSEGVDIYCDMNATAVLKNDDGTISVQAMDRAGRLHTHVAQKVFFATGSTPNVVDLCLEKVGIKYTKRGIVVNDNLQTTVDNIYAIGDVVGAVTLSRVAYYHAKAVVQNIYHTTGKKQHAINYNNVARVIFTQPILAAVGLTEQEAYKRFGGDLKIYRCEYNLLEKAHIDQNTQGIAKFICSGDGILLGAHILGVSAGEIIDVMRLGETFSKTFFEELGKIRTSPSYFDMIPKIAVQCEKDFTFAMEKELNNSFWSYITSFF